MNKFLQYTLLVFLIWLLQACDQSPDRSFVITGTLETVNTPAIEGDEPTSEGNEHSADWSTARIAVTRDTINSSGKFETVELASGTFEDGEVTLSGSVDHPTEVKISVETDGEEPLTLDTVIAPLTEISFLVHEYPEFNHANMNLFGVSQRVMEPDNKFSISGDLSSIDADFERATIRATAWEYDKRGERITLNYGIVLLDNGKFVIEASVDEPKVVNIAVIVPSSQENTQFKAIIEPGSAIEIIAQSSWLHDLAPISGTGKHAQLIETWQQSKEYLETEQEYRIAYQENQARAQSGEDTTSTGDDETPKHLELNRKLNRIRNKFLENVAANAEDPMDALLALEMNAFWGKEEALPIYDHLATSLDKDLVMRRVINDRNDHASHLETRGFDSSLVEGKIVPEFTLQNVDGEQISLYDLLEKNKLVLVEFWASWCGPCIETIPALKDIYAAYREHGFEIVSISIDDDHETWIEASEEYELPWVNLGEFQGWRGDVATSYGVTGIPKKYLVNSEGQIVQKDSPPAKIEELLAETLDASTN